MTPLASTKQNNILFKKDRKISTKKAKTTSIKNAPSTKYGTKLHGGYYTNNHLRIQTLPLHQQLQKNHSRDVLAIIGVASLLLNIFSLVFIF